MPPDKVDNCKIKPKALYSLKDGTKAIITLPIVSNRIHAHKEIRLGPASFL